MIDDLPLVEVVESSGRRRLPSRLTRLRKQVLGGRRAQQEEFESILEFAHIIAKRDPKALPALMKLIGRSAQARAMTGVLRRRQESVEEYDEHTALFDPSAPITADGRSLYNLWRKVPTPRSLELGVDLVLPWPWHGGRLIDSLCNLRPGGSWGAWRQDKNHQILLWLPLGVGWVGGGNHSLTAGILHAKGKVRPEATYDVSRVYKHVTCDGLEYKRTHDGSTIGTVSDLEMAAIFEIGRLIHKRRVRF